MREPTKIQLDVRENKLVRWFYISLGIVLVVLGIIGALLPVVPGTIFFILALIAFSKGSEHFYKKLIHNKWIGPHLQNYLEDRFIPIRTKIVVIACLWISIVFTDLFVLHGFYMRLAMVIIAVGVTIYISMHRSHKTETTEVKSL